MSIRIADKDFDRQPFLKESFYNENKDKLIEVQNKINDALKIYDTYKGIDFCDVSANGVQIRGHHRDVHGYCYPRHQITIEYDLSNIDDVVQEFVETWEEEDTEDRIRDYNKFLDFGRRYGWD